VRASNTARVYSPGESEVIVGKALAGGRRDNVAQARRRRRAAQAGQGGGAELIEMAPAFVMNHPAVTARIIGPRTMEHPDSQLPAAEVTLTDDVLDRIDELGPPGVSFNPADGGWQNPALEPGALRRWWPPR
jgi:aryl-alcohol dehydrogenase-like predicted oxidoreductase